MFRPMLSPEWISSPEDLVQLPPAGRKDAHVLARIDDVDFNSAVADRSGCVFRMSGFSSAVLLTSCDLICLKSISVFNKCVTARDSNRSDLQALLTLGCERPASQGI